ncbi:MAG: tRNA (adenosine(37)-N6)-threonylcarbamoyltransferase complex ATPase subunit type 1 TsaE [Candidatus Gracilibacteria bacterium]|nr:tRNA (adenosine(37)-N6)-threonylcarbamoyltransferase complex ATPase subunit type 1 TsaE [Candidatus Gracilibacteria bacterium]
MTKYLLSEITNIEIDLSKPQIIFLKGDLGSGKTTLSKHILNNLLNLKNSITSPTYTYYNKYGDNYHFDLYRLKNYDEFFAIGGEDILDNNNGIILIEWPDIIEKYYSADIIININKTNNENEREINIEYK